ncbi:MAG: GNAT family acetyltransferase [Phycisphaerae bacterium]|jgi:ribosomal protein S18 acetylase RimI-like enzyme|nr:GNAT family acetyltransferase [Phycisphaerae bacterium]
METEIVAFDNAVHRDQVIDLWKRVFAYKAPRNAPVLVIDKKLAFGDGLLFVAVSDDRVVGTIMAGYDGHRGWIYSLAVDRKHQRRGIGSQLLSHAESRLASLGCVKINLQVLDGNDLVEEFYEANGYLAEPRLSMAKTIQANIE